MIPCGTGAFYRGNSTLYEFVAQVCVIARFKNEKPGFQLSGRGIFLFDFHDFPNSARRAT